MSARAGIVLLGWDTAAPAAEGATRTSRPVWVRLRGHPPRVGRASLTPRSGARRIAQAVALALLWPPACLVAFLIPPHGEPLALAFFGGLFLIHRAWTTAYVVHHLEATCPRCGERLALRPNARLKNTLEVPCYACHFHPVLDPRTRAPAGAGGS
jgi:hypothetical protein